VCVCVFVCVFFLCFFALFSPLFTFPPPPPRHHRRGLGRQWWFRRRRRRASRSSSLASTASRMPSPPSTTSSRMPRPNAPPRSVPTLHVFLCSRPLPPHSACARPSSSSNAALVHHSFTGTLPSSFCHFSFLTPPLPTRPSHPTPCRALGTHAALHAQVAAYSVGSSTVVYLLVSIAGYSAFGPGVQADVLDSFASNTNVFVQVCACKREREREKEGTRCWQCQI